jgi:hypothetical protein
MKPKLGIDVITKPRKLGQNLRDPATVHRFSPRAQTPHYEQYEQPYNAVPAELEFAGRHRTVLFTTSHRYCGTQFHKYSAHFLAHVYFTEPAITPWTK